MYTYVKLVICLVSCYNAGVFPSPCLVHIAHIIEFPNFRYVQAGQGAWFVVCKGTRHQQLRPCGVATPAVRFHFLLIDASRNVDVFLLMAGSACSDVYLYAAAMDLPLGFRGREVPHFGLACLLEFHALQPATHPMLPRTTPIRITESFFHISCSNTWNKFSCE